MGKVNIATITCHDVYNYGASLQAYALQKYCQNQGLLYKIIDYKPDYLSNHYKLWLVTNNRYNFPILKQLYLLAKLPGRIKRLKKKNAFDKFTLKFLNLTEKKYHTNQELKENPPKADLYIAGSDQIWNTLFRNGWDKSFYLNFAPAESRKISYAASFATNSLKPKAAKFVEEELQNFDSISVRESSGLKLLKDCGIKNGVLVADPVFLLSKDDWSKIIPHDFSINEDYILVYDCEKSDIVRNIAKYLKKSTGYKLVSVSPTKGNFIDINKELSGPIGFLQLIKNSKMVLANSFHALAFSLIFKKEFYIVKRSEGINSRMADFLKYLSLDSRLISSIANISGQELNYNLIESKIEDLINQSKKFLNTEMSKSERH